MNLQLLARQPIHTTMPLLLEHSTWTQHTPFAMYLVSLLRPSLLVELGTYRGTSYCAFCQAITELNLDTVAFGIDTWIGEVHTGEYDHNVYEQLQAHHEPLYGAFSTLIRSTFDMALQHFADGSIDLLHIDGLHTYEAARHDFETWLPKLSDTAVVVFHDTNVRDRDFGVHRLWDELCPKYPHFEMTHGHGLGILAVGRKPQADILELTSQTEEEARYTRTLFHQLGWRVEIYQELLGLRSERAALQSTAELHHRVWSYRPIRILYYYLTEGVRGIARRAMRQQSESDQ